MYMTAELAPELKRFGPEARPADASAAPDPRMVRISDGPARLGASRGEQAFGWDNEYDAHTVQVDAFEMDVYDVTNGQYLEFLASGAAPGVPHTWIRGDNGAWRLRTVLGEQPLPLSWPVQVTHQEALAYCRWVGKDLPSEAEWTRAAYGGDPSRPYPWGSEAPEARHGNLGWQLWTWARVGSFPAGVSPFGVHDLLGTGWEWTSTPFAPFPGFEPMPLYPQYSSDFFDGKHFVVKGASQFTDVALLRRPFRNWYFGHYPYVHATFRGVKR
jgi:formylglycine-generating enzyme required for sulfatase activity